MEQLERSALEGELTARDSLLYLLLLLFHFVCSREALLAFGNPLLYGLWGVELDSGALNQDRLSVRLSYQFV